MASTTSSAGSSPSSDPGPTPPSGRAGSRRHSDRPVNIITTSLAEKASPGPSIATSTRPSRSTRSSASSKQTPILDSTSESTLSSVIPDSASPGPSASTPKTRSRMASSRMSTAARSMAPITAGSGAAATSAGLTAGSIGAGPVNAAAAPFPLSARKAPALDLKSVQRRLKPAKIAHDGRAPEEEKKTDRHFGLTECPVYRPTTAEFADPLGYIQSIAAEGKRFGIVKIIPPDTWNPPFAIDTERFHFRTRRQELNEVEGSNRESVTYLEALAKFHKQNSNANLHRFPCVDKRPLDLYRLKRLVEEKGGFDAVCKTKRWAEIGRDLGYSGKIMSSLSTSLKNSYQKWIQSFEQYIAKNKSAVFGHDSTTTSPTKESVSGGDAADDDPMTDVTDVKIEPKIEPKAEAKSECRPAAAPSGFTAVNRADRPAPTRQPSGCGSVSGSTVRTTLITGLGMAKKRDLDAAESPGTASSRRSKRIKRDSSGTSAPAMPSTQTSVTAGTATPTPAPTDSGASGQPACDVCGKVDERVRQCDGCDGAFHLSCVDDKVWSAEAAEWHCPKCLVGTGEYGFQDGSTYSLRQFQEKAEFFKQSHFSRDRDPEGAPLPERRRDKNGTVIVTDDEVEAEFWRLADSLTEPVEVEYGADLHSGIHGSGFPTVERCPAEPYARDGWNLNNLPLEKSSLFRHIKADINGMTVPWLYVGMCFSCFCWHAEDHNTYSINYQHFGSTKTWYAIPADSFDAFDRATRELAPELTEKQPDLLYQLVTLFAPDRLRALGVDVYATDQRAGQFVVTFPQAYHAGFNHGFNLNEAVNFALADWEPVGQEGVDRLRQFRRPPCFSHDELLTTISGRDTTVATARWLAPALVRMRRREMGERARFRRRHLRAMGDGHDCAVFRPDDDENEEVDEMVDVEDEVSDEDESEHDEDDEDETGPNSAGGDNRPVCGLAGAQEQGELNDDEHVCSHCNGFTFLSRFFCVDSNKSYCLVHAGVIPCCDQVNRTGKPARARFGRAGSHILYTRFSAAELAEMVDRKQEIAATPERWVEKVSRLATGASTPIRAVRALLAEGTRLQSQWDVGPALEAVRQYVDRFSRWHDRASVFLGRKQGRRKTRDKDKEKEKDKDTDGSSPVGSPTAVTSARSVEVLERLIAEAEAAGFESAEVSMLRDRQAAVEAFRQSVVTKVATASSSTDVSQLITLGEALAVTDLAELALLARLRDQMRWWEDAREATDERVERPIRTRCDQLISSAFVAGIPDDDDAFKLLKRLLTKADGWEQRAATVMALESVPDAQLDSLVKASAALPVPPTVLETVQMRLWRQRRARETIVTLVAATEVGLAGGERPAYRKVRAAVDAVADLSTPSKPAGTAELERQLKRHEDWMRRGKKLFGKANAPLHILLQHMQYVHDRNQVCFNISDDQYDPARVDGRPNQSDRKEEKKEEPTEERKDEKQAVFCICRKPEWGMMVECELCHEWYHGRCLKISRTKLKEDEKFTCPICDHRLQIPRDAARPKLEDCVAWQDEIGGLPFEPEEEPTLRGIVDTAIAFRTHLSGLIGPMMAAMSGGPSPGSSYHSNPPISLVRFVLRKLEGADILLVQETNVLRARLHDLAPVAPTRPQPIAESLSTRKPRPTKQQKMMVQYGVSTPEDLPAHVKIRRRREPVMAGGLGDRPALSVASGNTMTVVTGPGRPVGHHAIGPPPMFVQSGPLGSSSGQQSGGGAVHPDSVEQSTDRELAV